VPRHPINIYYSASTEAQEVDEYNTLYLPPSLGGECVPSSTTTCETKPASFAEIVNSVVSGMFQNMMNNDPRPSYVHQTNLLGQPPAGPATTGTPPATPDTTGDGLLYSVLNPLLAQYKEYFAASAPFEQLTLAAIGNLLAKQAAWKSALGAGQVSGYIEGSKVTIQNSGAAISAPLTGVTGVGSPYGGIQSGWTSVPAVSGTYTAPTTWPETAPSTEAPKVTTNPVSKTVVAGESASFTAAASGVPAPTVQWQVSTNGGVTFANDTSDAGNTTGTLTVAATTTSESGREYRAVFKNASGSATSVGATLTVKTPPPVVSGVSSYSLGPLKFVLITGKNFTNVQTVDFGSKPASYGVLSSTEILALAPSGSGTVEITVKTTSGTSATSSADRFTY